MKELELQYLLEGLDVDVSGHWSTWGFSKFPIKSYEFAKLEEYRDRVVLAYHLYNLIGLEHARRLLANAPKDARILDAGGGTGRKAIPLALDGFTNIHVVDLAPAWLQLAKEKAAVAGLEDALTFSEGDILSLEKIEDNTYDFVISLGGPVSYCGSPAQALATLSRVLVPGGSLVADGIHGKLGCLRMTATSGQLKELEGLLGYVEDKKRSLIDCPGLFPEELEEMALKAGLSEIKVGSEFAFIPKDDIRVGDDLARWCKTVIDLEMTYVDDPRFLGAAGLVLRCRKPD